MAGYVDRSSAGIAHEEAADPPRLIAKLPDNLQTVDMGPGVRCVDIGDLDRYVDLDQFGVDCGRALQATITCVVGVVVEASISIPSSSIATRKPRKSS